MESTLIYYCLSSILPWVYDDTTIEEAKGWCRSQPEFESARLWLFDYMSVHGTVPDSFDDEFLDYLTPMVNRFGKDSISNFKHWRNQPKPNSS